MLYRITPSKNNILKDIIDNHEVFQLIQSVQFKELKINTYQIIVNQRGIIYIVWLNRVK